MNSRLDWLVLSDYYSIYVTNAPPNKNTGKYSSVFLFAKRGIEEPSHKRSVDRVRQSAVGSCFRG